MANELGKKVAAEAAAQLIRNNQIVGLGTGSTAELFVAALAARAVNEKLQLTTVTTSQVTAALADRLGLTVVDIDAVNHIDITVDGADEVDARLDGIKGGGGALLMEKIVAVNSSDYVWVVDNVKVVAQLGKFPLPVEVVPYGAGLLFQKFESLGYVPSWRLTADGSKFITDQKHFIIDLHLEKISEPEVLARKLSKMVGVVEQGLFLNLAQTVNVGFADGHIDIKKRAQ